MMSGSAYSTDGSSARRAATASRLRQRQRRVQRKQCRTRRPLRAPTSCRRRRLPTTPAFATPTSVAPDRSPTELRSLTISCDTICSRLRCASSQPSPVSAACLAVILVELRWRRQGNGDARYEGAGQTKQLTVHGRFLSTNCVHVLLLNLHHRIKLRRTGKLPEAFRRSINFGTSLRCAGAVRWTTCASPAIGRTYLTPAVSPNAARIGFITAAESLVAMRGLTMIAATTGASEEVMEAGAEQATSATGNNTKTATNARAIFMRGFQS